MIDLFLEARAEILQIFQLLFWRINDFINTFWLNLTFSTCIFTKYSLTCSHMIHKIPNPELLVFKNYSNQPVLFVYFLLLFSSKVSVKIRNWEFMKLCGESTKINKLNDSHSIIFVIHRFWSSKTIILHTYCKVASSNTSRLEAHAGFFRLLMKGIFNPYFLWPFHKKLISNACYSELPTIR